MGKRIVIIDGNSLINRAYYAMQRLMITREGLYTQGVYGFLSMLNKIQNDYEPEYCIVAFDRKAPTFRHVEYEEYKAGRKKMPPELAMQLPLLKEVLAAMQIKTLEIDGWEADDIIGTVAKKAEAEGLSPLIITGDKDALQLVSDKTKVLITRKGISEFDLFNRENFYETYGFTSEQMVDYKGLMGDQSDNIPGIPGVGEKTAQKLILEFGTVENLVSNTDKISNEKLRLKVEDNAQLALMSKRLATIQTEVPLEIIIEEFKMKDPNYPELRAVYEKLEFKSFLKKLREGLEKVPAPGQIPSGFDISESDENSGLGDEIKIVKATTEKDLELIRNTFKSGLPVALKVISDDSHISVPKIHGIALLCNKEYFYFNGEKPELTENLYRLLEEERPSLIGYNLISDYYALLAQGFMDKASGSKSIFNTGFDIAIAQYVLEPGRASENLWDLVVKYLGVNNAIEEIKPNQSSQIGLFDDPHESNLEYGLKWCHAVSALVKPLLKAVRDEEMETLLIDVEFPLVEVLASMEAKGFHIRQEKLVQSGSIIDEQIVALETEIYDLSGETFNINSPLQLGEILFEKLGLPTGKKNKRGYSTNADVLEPLKDDYPIVKLILEYRTVAKLKSTYIDGLIPLIHTDGKIHPHFKQNVTATGRLSCTEPNLQNIPIRQEQGRLLRKAFVPRKEDYVLVGGDYSQIELRILAHMSGDERMIEGFSKGDDVHRITASQVFGVPEAQVTSLQRSSAKAVNFGVIYGMSSFGLSGELNISRKEAERYINLYFKKYTGVKAYMDNQIRLCKERGYVTTLLGRRRWIPEIKASNYQVRQLGERFAMNSPIQGTGADIMKLAMLRVYEAIRALGKAWHLILQVHDELILEGPKSEVDEIKAMLKKEMETAIELMVPITVDVNTGANWYELK